MDQKTHGDPAQKDAQFPYQIPLAVEKLAMTTHPDTESEGGNLASRYVWDYQGSHAQATQAEMGPSSLSHMKETAWVFQALSITPRKDSRDIWCTSDTQIFPWVVFENLTVLLCF